MKMQESQVSVASHEDGEGYQSAVFHLSGPLSEWLFSTNFWSDFNALHGTMFDQYEEDEADAPVVLAVADALAERLRALRKSNELNVIFVYRWASEHTPIAASVSRENLLYELLMFRNFLVDAAEKDLRLSFSL